MKRVYVNEKWCLGCRLCEYNCAFANSGLRSMTKALKGKTIRPRVRVEEREEIGAGNAADIGQEFRHRFGGRRFSGAIRRGVALDEDAVCMYPLRKVAVVRGMVVEKSWSN